LAYQKLLVQIKNEINHMEH